MVALVAVALTSAVKESGFHATVPGFWVIAAMFAWAIHWRLYGGLMAAVLLSVDDIVTRHYLSETTYGNLFLLLIGGPIVGLMVDSLLRSAARTAAAERARPRRSSAPSWPAPSTTACCRRCRWSSAGLPSSAPRASGWRCWPVSRSWPCAR